MENHNPLQEFHTLFCQANKDNDGQELNAMLLTTVGKDGFPHSRMVLLKKYDWDGFTFFTNYGSKKAQDIAFNDKVHLLFRWYHLGIEIAVEGVAEKVSNSVSENYFELRPRASKIGAHASKQSQVITSRKVLEDAFAKAETTFETKEVPKPKHWGGYLVKPLQITIRKIEDAFWENKVFTLNEQNYEWALERYFIIKGD